MTMKKNSFESLKSEQLEIINGGFLTLGAAIGIGLGLAGLGAGIYFGRKL